MLLGGLLSYKDCATQHDEGVGLHSVRSHVALGAPRPQCQDVDLPSVWGCNTCQVPWS